MLPSSDLPTLDQIALSCGADKSSAFHDYARIYEAHLAPRRHEPLLILELGVLRGQSLRMWRDYFPKAQVFGVDIDPRCASLDLGPRIRVYTGNQTDGQFLAKVANEAGGFDLLVDDASHRSRDQIASIEILWPFLRRGGLYAMEDTSCAFWPEFAGNCSLMIWLTDRVGDVHLHGKRRHGNARRFETVAKHNPLSDWEQSLYSIHAYNSLIFFQRR
jgi:hypothetical protein